VTGQLLHLTEAQGRRLRARRPAVADAERVAAAYGALADPTRLSLALSLRGGRELCVCDLAWITERSQTLVSHHMKQLRQQELVSARKQGKMTMYCLTERGDALLEAAVDELGARR
jgi:ArsR family transcriptional regulator, lead/cadmium/zinc/bismuth-responsive transcriptional repressor